MYADATARRAGIGLSVLLMALMGRVLSDVFLSPLLVPIFLSRIRLGQNGRKIVPAGGSGTFVAAVFGWDGWRAFGHDLLLCGGHR
ncbi:hypothetical protein IE00_00130 [Paracoccus sp. SM22M-07]|nr:hypothetical protein IE00_00130 [Paracoccus sp. SM22M-07]